MNRKGFTLIELLATLVVLGVIVGITVIGISNIFKNAKDKTEDVFVGTIRDALDMYLTGKEAKSLNFSHECLNKIGKSYGDKTVWRASSNFQLVIGSEYLPITDKDFVNPANEQQCNVNTVINVYKDEDFVYYYKVEGNLDCLTNDRVISNLPEGFVC